MCWAPGAAPIGPHLLAACWWERCYCALQADLRRLLCFASLHKQWLGMGIWEAAGTGKQGQDGAACSMDRWTQAVRKKGRQGR